MNLTKLVVLSRKIHRLCVTLMILTGLVMMVTGLKMKYYDVFWFIDANLSVRIHSFLAPLFTFVLFLMMLTGTILYYYPKIQKWMSKNNPTP